MQSVEVIEVGGPVGSQATRVVEALRRSEADRCVVVAGGARPDLVDSLAAALDDADVAIAVSRPPGWWRHRLGLIVLFVTRAMFPKRLRTVADPLAGDFAVRRSAVDLDELQPQGATILLEILVRGPRQVREVSTVRRHRTLSLRHAFWLLWHLTTLRFGRMSGFAAIGAMGAVLNVAIVWVLVSVYVPFVVAAIIAAEVTMVGNFVLQERLVFADMIADADGTARRFVRSFTFNNVESLIRISVAAWMVDHGILTGVIATAVTLAVAFVARFVFHALVVYAPRSAV